jgi:hypothetical protein
MLHTERYAFATLTAGAYRRSRHEWTHIARLIVWRRERRIRHIAILSRPCGEC